MLRPYPSIPAPVPSAHYFYASWLRLKNYANLFGHRIALLLLPACHPTSLVSPLAVVRRVEAAKLHWIIASAVCLFQLGLLDDIPPTWYTVVSPPLLSHSLMVCLSYLIYIIRSSSTYCMIFVRSTVGTLYLALYHSLLFSLFPRPTFSPSLPHFLSMPAHLRTKTFAKWQKSNQLKINLIRTWLAKFFFHVALWFACTHFSARKS